MKKIAIFGAGGLGREVAMLLEQINEKESTWELIGFFDDGLVIGEEIYGYKVIGNAADLNNYKEDLNVVFAIGEPTVKRKVVNCIDNPNLYYPVLIHPSALLGKDVMIGEGSIITAGNILTVNINIGKHVILNLAGTVGHDVTIGAYSSVMPGVNISGEVKIDEAVLIGTGVKTIQQIKIGANTIVGAGAVIISNLPSDCTAVGIPAKVIKQKVSGRDKL